MKAKEYLDKFLNEAKKEKKSFDGDFLVDDIDVSFTYFNGLDGVELTDELKERLEQEARERAEYLIKGDYREGELNYEDEDHQISGWIKIKR